jgi:hypothetical protein
MLAMYINSNSFSICGDLTNTFNFGSQIKATCSGIDYYGSVENSLYNDGNTLVELAIGSDILYGDIMDVKYSVIAYTDIPKHFHIDDDIIGGINSHVTFETLYNNGDVGETNDKLAMGNHWRKYNVNKHK